MIVHFKEFAYTTDAQLQTDVTTWFDQLHQQGYPARDIRLNFVTATRVLVTAGYGMGPFGMAGPADQLHGLAAPAASNSAESGPDLDAMVNTFIDMARDGKLDGKQIETALGTFCVYLTGIQGHTFARQFRTKVAESPQYQEWFGAAQAEGEG